MNKPRRRGKISRRGKLRTREDIIEFCCAMGACCDRKLQEAMLARFFVVIGLEASAAKLAARGYLDHLAVAPKSFRTVVTDIAALAGVPYRKSS